MIPFFHKGLVHGADDSFHISRLYTLALALKRGDFPVKFHAEECFGYGYGVGYFYSNFFLYFPAFLIVLGISLNTAFKIFAVLIFIAVFFSMFISTYLINGKDFNSAYTSAILYMISHALVVMFYQAFGTGRCLSMIFFPLAFAGIYLLSTQKVENMKHAQTMLIIGFIGLIYSHVLSTLLAVFVCCMILLLNIKSWITDFKKWGALSKSVIIVCVLTASYWIPMYEQYRKQVLKCHIPLFWPAEHVVQTKNLFTYDGIGYVIGFMLLLSTIISIYSIFYKKATNHKLVTFTIISWILCGLMISQTFWNIANEYLYTIQFPDRLYSIATVCVAISLGLLLPKININGKFSIILTILLAMLSFTEASYWHITRNNNYNIYYDYDTMDPTAEWAGISSGEEYLPIETQREYFVDAYLAIDENGNKIYGTKNGKTYTFKWNDSDTREVTIPFVWYKGYVASDKDGNQLSTDKNEEYGFVKVCAPDGETIPTGTEITVTIEFTNYTKIAYAINILGIIYLIFYIAKSAYTKRTNSKVKPVN